MSGKLGSAALVADTWTVVADFPSVDVRSVSFNYRVVNPTSEEATIDVSVGTSNPPLAKDQVEPTVRLPAGGMLESTGFVASPGEKVLVRSSVAGVVVRVHGHTEGGN